MPVEHYENFPVASFLLARAMRAPIEAIYRFARAADDLADEGDAPDEAREVALANFAAELDRLEAGTPSSSPIFLPLAEAVAQYRLPVDLFRDLLSAFAQDVRKKRYATYAEVLEYSRRSANPIGRLVLAVWEGATGGAVTETMRAQSDAICSALQCVNFWQDVALDWQKGRVYLPEEEMRRFGVEEAELAAMAETWQSGGALRLSSRWRELMAYQVTRTRALMETGASLAASLSGRLAWEVRLSVEGGLRILEKMERSGYDVFCHRPVLRGKDWCLMAARAGFQFAGLSFFRRPLMTPERYCRQKAARSGSSFYLAFRFLPARKRRAMNALYAFCREADDAVDDAGAEKDAARRLAFWRGEIARVYAGKPRHPVGFALLRAREEFSLEREHFFALLEGMEMDLRGTRYPDFAALSLYCYRAAGVVGLLSARIFSRESGKDTAEYARNLGIAFQLTNILRDVREDARRGRIYLPREELRQYGVTEEDLLRGRDSEAFRALMRAQCRRARDFYARALGVFASLSAEERKNQRPGLMMAAVYRALLEEMECADFAVLRRRVTLSAGRKLWRMGRVFFTGRL